MSSNTHDTLTALLAWKALRFWEVREGLSLVISASIAAMLWLPWITGKPTITILETPALMWIVIALLKPGCPPTLLATL